MVEKVLQLKCSCNNYPWGKKGSQSLAAQLAAKTPGTDFKIDEEKPYSEMWLGTYPALPSYVLETGENLQDVLNKHPDELIGQGVISKFNNTDLPYLPKVLSIEKALPLQLHPDKGMAEALHRRNPSDFTDPNHKPEIALALSDFEAFCGFKPLDEISELFKLEPLKRFLPPVMKPSFDDQVLKHVVKQILSASEDTIKETTDALLVCPRKGFGKDIYIPLLIPRLVKQYDKCDPGIIVALTTMNYLRLKPGESIYIPADGIHAYLSGDIMECMARSNNVLNSGFCPRADRNVELFVSCLTFTPHAADECILKSQRFERSKEGKTKIFAPPLSEFNMLLTKLAKGERESLSKINGPSILLVQKGTGTMKAHGKEFNLSEGYVFFVGQGTDLEFQAESPLRLFTAFVE